MVHITLINGAETVDCKNTQRLEQPIQTNYQITRTK